MIIIITPQSFLPAMNINKIASLYGSNWINICEAGTDEKKQTGKWMEVKNMALALLQFLLYMQCYFPHNNGKKVFGWCNKNKLVSFVVISLCDKRSPQTQPAFYVKQAIAFVNVNVLNKTNMSVHIYMCLCVLTIPITDSLMQVF